MSLSNLTTSGWIWFALTLVYCVDHAIDVALLMSGRIKTASLPTAVPMVMVAWLLWLVTP